MKRQYTKMIVIFLFIAIHCGNVFAFLHTEGKNIVDSNNKPFILRGMGLGGWMLQEGYMMKTSGIADTQHEIKQKISELIGESDMEEFYNIWRANHCTRTDIDSLASWGFNSVRLAMHYNLFTLPIEEENIAGENTWLTTGFELTDSLLSWCEKNEMYLILDLHAAPGGQGRDAAISDYDPSKPSLWESTENKAKTVALWRKLAERYAYEPWIGGYDLLNETNWEMQGNYYLKELYSEITNGIREVDPNHIIFIEGNWWANDFTGLTPPWDDNLVYSFHKYWNYNDQASIQYMITMRNAQNVPVWCGEAGENSNVWFTDAISLLEENGIGWAWWLLKKIDNLAAPFSITLTDGYRNILDYWSGAGFNPGAENAKKVLFDLAEKANSENCRYQRDVIDALSRQLDSDKILAFTEHNIPGTIYAVNYDLGKLNFAYKDNDIANYNVSSGQYTNWNMGGQYRNDAVDIGSSSQLGDFSYYVGWTESGEWLRYTYRALFSGEYNIRIHYAGGTESGGQLQLGVDADIITTVFCPSTGGWDSWDIKEIPITLNSGEHSLSVEFISAGLNLYKLEFILTESATEYDTFKELFIKPLYPNPSTVFPTLQLVCTQEGDFKLVVYNILGQKIETIFNNTLEVGEYQFSYKGDLSQLSSGIYFYRIHYNNSAKTIKFSYIH